MLSAFAEQDSKHSFVDYTFPSPGSVRNRAQLGGRKYRGRGNSCTALQVGVLLVGKRLLCGGLHLLAVSVHLGDVDLHLRGSEGRGGDKLLWDCQ